MNTYLYYKKYFQTCEVLHYNSRQMQSTYLFVNPLKKWAVYVQHDDVGGGGYDMDNGLTLYVQVKHGIVQIAFLVIQLVVIFLSPATIHHLELQLISNADIDFPIPINFFIQVFDS